MMKNLSKLARFKVKSLVEFSIVTMMMQNKKCLQTMIIYGETNQKLNIIQS